MLKVTLTEYEDPSQCPFRDVLDRIGSKWGFMALVVLEDGPQRFNQMKQIIGDISQRVLTQTLRELERDGFISRTVYPVSPPKVEYELTELGRSMLEPIKIFVDWAKDAHDEIKSARQDYDERHKEQQHN